MKQRPAPPNPLLRCLQPLHIVYTKLMLVRTQDRNLFGLNNLTKAHNALGLTIPCPTHCHGSGSLFWLCLAVELIECYFGQVNPGLSMVLLFQLSHLGLHQVPLPVFCIATLRLVAGAPCRSTGSINQLIGGSGQALTATCCQQ